jgi:hypothetical protein
MSHNTGQVHHVPVKIVCHDRVSIDLQDFRHRTREWDSDPPASQQ